MKTAEPAVAMKVGLMVPANNTTMERELAAWLPEGSTVTTVKIPRGDGLLTRDTIPAYRDRAIALAREHFSRGEVELLAYGCTAAGFLSGPAGDAELARQLGEATSLPVVTTARAMVNALQHDRARKVAVVTPYGEEVNAQLSAFLKSADIGVVRLASLNAPDVTALGRITAPRGARPRPQDDGSGLRRPLHRLLAASNPRDPGRPCRRIRSTGLVLDQRDCVGRRTVADDGVTVKPLPLKIRRSPRPRSAEPPAPEPRAHAPPGRRNRPAPRPDSA